MVLYKVLNIVDSFMCIRLETSLILPVFEWVVKGATDNICKARAMWFVRGKLNLFSFELTAISEDSEGVSAIRFCVSNISSMFWHYLKGCDENYDCFKNQLKKLRLVA